MFVDLNGEGEAYRSLISSHFSGTMWGQEGPIFSIPNQISPLGWPWPFHPIGFSWTRAIVHSPSGGILRSPVPPSTSRSPEL